MKSSTKNLAVNSDCTFHKLSPKLFLAMMCLVPLSAFAAGSDGAVCQFFGNINGLLNIASIAVVTIAIIFAGYQIAFAHKRISDVAPVLIGAVLIGGAAQFAKMILPDMTDSCSTVAPAGGGMAFLNLVHSLQQFYA